MNELIKVESHLFGGEAVQTVNARNLHGFLGSKQEFRHWIKDRIEQYGFILNNDFTTSEKIIRGGRTVDYHVSLDMAKELAMVERNEKGKQARQYFIECEKRVKAVATLGLPDFNNPVLAARAWADEVEAKQVALAQLEAKCLGDVAKLLGYKPHAFPKVLAADKVIFKRDSVRIPQPPPETLRLVL